MAARDLKDGGRIAAQYGILRSLQAQRNPISADIAVGLGPVVDGCAMVATGWLTFLIYSSVTLVDRPLGDSPRLLNGIEDAMVATMELAAVASVTLLIGHAVKIDSPGPCCFGRSAMASTIN